MKNLQIQKLHRKADQLHRIFGSKQLCAVHGAGLTKNPRVMFIFINPTGKNISAQPKWTGMRAQWLGTKQVWKLFYGAGLMSENIFNITQEFAPNDWTPEFCRILYSDFNRRKIYITNCAKCTQKTAKPIDPKALRSYLPLLMEEISLVNPGLIITFGNQISSLILDRQISVKNYSGIKHERLSINRKSYKVFPVYYPVGQGMPNLPKAIKRIKKILSVLKSRSDPVHR